MLRLIFPVHQRPAPYAGALQVDDVPLDALEQVARLEELVDQIELL